MLRHLIKGKNRVIIMGWQAAIQQIDMRYFLIVLYIFLITGNIQAQSWKKAAQDSILKYRTTPVKILILDDSGNPASDITVKVKMLQHEFKWGTTVSISEIRNLVANGSSIGSYTPYYGHLSLFNSVTPENAGKWKGWLDFQQRNLYLKTVNWLEAEGIANRGHTCVWESERFNAIPDFLMGFSDTAEIRNAIKSHITGYLGTLKDDLYEVDVVNELIHEQHIVKDLLHVSDPALEHSKWYKWAKQAAPNVDLIVNEFNLFQSGNNFYQRYITYVKKMIADGAPIDGVGMQGHFFSAMPAYSELKKRIDQLKVLGLPMKITEFDMVGSNYTDMERVLYAVFSEPQIDNFTMWGAWDGRQWRNNGPLFYDNWNLKPSGEAWMDLVRGEWWTDSTFITDASGIFELNAYKGNHIVQIQKGNKVYTDTILIGDEKAEFHYNVNLIKSEIPTASISLENKLDEYNIYQPALIKINSNLPDSIQYVEYKENLFTVHKSFPPDFEFSMTSTGVGKRKIYAQIVCKNGYVFQTDTIELKFVNKNAFPIITNVYPFDNQFFEVGMDVPVICTAEDYDGEIWKMEISGIYGDSILTDTNSPFKIVMSDLVPGNYKVKVKMLDSLYAFDQKTISFTVFDPDEQNLSISFPNRTNQDVEQDNTGTIILEGDLDLGEKMCGIRFPNAGIPKNAIIDSAFVQFTTDNSSLGNITIPIYAERATNAAPFSTQANNLSAREKTQHVNWSPDEWLNAGENGEAQKTSNLKPLIDELLNLDSWSKSSPVVMIFGFSAENEKRRAVSYDINSPSAPKLSVYYHGGFDLIPPQPPAGLQIVTQTDNSVTVSWNKISNSEVLGYFVYVDGKKYLQNAIKSTKLELTGLSNSVAHEIFVTSISNLSIESEPGKSVISTVVASEFFEINNGLLVYPNPFSSGVTIQLLHKYEKLSVSVYNQSGDCVRTLEMQNTTDIFWDGSNNNGSNLPAGIYFMKVNTNSQSTFIKLVKVQ